MAKTRSQTGNITIKKEEEDCKPILCLNGVTTATRNKITKRKPSKRNNRRLPAQQVKVEEDTDTKLLLKSASNYSKLSKRTYVSQEQIDQLIDAIVNDKMSIRKAARRAKLSINTASYYYNVYKNDPDKKIPLPRSRYVHPPRVYTKKHTESLIRYITFDKLNVKEASAKANLSYNSGHYYYSKYLKDPKHEIPIPQSCQRYTQDQKNEFIGYIINDKMSIIAASKKAKMSAKTGHSYYRNYFKHQNTSIPKPSHLATRKRYTQEQIKEVISYIVDDNMSIRAASRKAHINKASASNYYYQYLKDHNMDISASRFGKRYSQDEINQLIGYIVGDKMTITAASKKANIACTTGSRYYRQYLKDNNLDVPIRESITQDQKNKLISYIIDDMMTISAASKKANVSRYLGLKYYERYRNEQKR